MTYLTSEMENGLVTWLWKIWGVNTLMKRGYLHMLKIPHVAQPDNAFSSISFIV